MTSFRDYSAEKERWITFVESPYYPDTIETAIELYEPVIRTFGELLEEVDDCEELFRRISEVYPQNRRIQLLRVFRRYVSPDTSVEMLKKKTNVDTICREFGYKFRSLDDVKGRFKTRPLPDPALIALLEEYRERGKKGYSLTAAFFEWFEMTFGDTFSIVGPAGAGPDINLYKSLPDYPKDRRPVDFLILDTQTATPYVIGLARYDSDRGGAQEDDRTSGYRDFVTELLRYSSGKGFNLKILFVNDGPGLLLGSMWTDYCELEEGGKGRVMVSTLKMLDERLTAGWIHSDLR